MNKGDLVNEVAKVVNTKKEAQEAVDCVFSSIAGALKKGDTVTLVGFGSFKVVQEDCPKWLELGDFLFLLYNHLYFNTSYQST